MHNMSGNVWFIVLLCDTVKYVHRNMVYSHSALRPGIPLRHLTKAGEGLEHSLAYNPRERVSDLTQRLVL